MVPQNYSKFDQVRVSIAGRPLLTSFVSNVPGLKVTTKRKKQMSKSADHSSTQPPAYERIKAQLECRRKKRQQVPQPQPGHSEKRNHNVRGGGRREPEAVQQAGGSNKETQGSKILDKGPTDEEKAAATEGMPVHRKYREAVAAEKKKRRIEKEHEEAMTDLEDAEMGLEDAEMSFEDVVQEWLGRSQENEAGEVLAANRREKPQHSQTAHDGPGSQAVESVEHPKALSQQQERRDKLASQKMSKKRFIPYEELLTEPDSDVSIQPPHKKGPPSQESSTESESELEEDLSIQPPHLPRGNKRVSLRFIFTSSFNVFVSMHQHLSVTTYR